MLSPVFLPISLSDLSLRQAGRVLFCFVFPVYVPIRSPSFTWRPRVQLSCSGEDRVEDTVEGTPTRTRTQLHLFHCLAHAHVYPSLSACQCTGLSYRTANMKGKTHLVRYSARHICGFPPDAPRAQYGCMTGDPRIWVRGSLIAAQGGWGSHSLTASLPNCLTTCDCHNCHNSAGTANHLLRCQPTHLSPPRFFFSRPRLRLRPRPWPSLSLLTTPCMTAPPYLAP